MKKLLLIALLGSVYGTIINVPSEYTTIQEGIDAAVDTDTVLVAQGAYYENLIIEKNITLTSNAIYDDLSLWTEYSLTFGQYELLNENIEYTVINGSLDTNGEDVQSVIYINSPEGECIEPVVFGFTITGGDGTLVTYMEEGNEIQERRGGGFYSNNALPEIHYNFIHDNNGTSESPIHSGGGTDIDLNERCEGDIDLSYNFYRDNDALYGKTLSTNGYAGSLDMSHSIFDVYNCPEEEVTSVWVDVEEEVEVDFQYSAGDLCSITEDVWVSPDGDDYLNTGTSQSSAFRTIKVALELIAPEDDDPVTIFLTEGTFSPSTTGEPFPITMISNVNLIGQGEEVTIIEAEQTDIVIIMEYCENNVVSDLTITGGLTQGVYPYYNGGGMWLYESDPTLMSVTISGNTADAGGGMGLIFSSNPTLMHVTISGNTAEEGGGMWLYDSDPTLMRVTISGNTADAGGGMYVYSSKPTLTNVTIANNTVDEDGGGMNIRDSNPTIRNSIIWENNQESIYLYSGYEEPFITYSNIEGGWAGEGNININADPLFEDQRIDYTLQGDSPCIDAGTVIEDIDYCGEAIDMGAYEYCGGGIDAGGECDVGYVTDCVDEDCCPESWIGDGFVDCENQAYGCDLTCYDNDGGDCEGGTEGGTDGGTDGGGDCEEGFVVDCRDEDCCPESWIGDGFADCEDQAWGCDLTCYDNDGGDCEGGDGAGDGGTESCTDCEFDFSAYGSECCETAWDEYGIDCATLEASYNWDCSGCSCPGDVPCEDQGLIECEYSAIEGGNCAEDESGCLEAGDCTAGQIADCDGSDECWPEHWIGDGFPDCEDQQYGADLTCYDNDGGDCEECGAELADVTGDGQINILDLVQIANLILETSTPAYECAADYNEDGQVNILDLVQIANYILDN